MHFRDWRNPEDYSFAQGLNGAQWAWEFLRRNPRYQEEGSAFHEVWQLLERAYGRPPNRDFPAWKADPRAWVNAEDCPDSDCRVDQDKVLIECAMVSIAACRHCRHDLGIRAYVVTEML